MYIYIYIYIYREKPLLTREAPVAVELVQCFGLRVGSQYPACLKGCSVFVLVFNLRLA